ncbi:MAG TPA: tRNA (adenosine(37)-N6)-threonylcarbamoyltransferase complex dimerization subunit type 1 TsaB [Bryobacteraceae bacterium]|nr:tRNA (adenosine(37)-N6)-threonylcarbamoyltransferase complex dimerization subunit type 1 TsaB [Bryobacteraceae bacterium]
MTELILAVDTTHEFGSLALLRGDDVLEETLLHSPEGFGQIIFGRLAELLARHKLSTADMDCFAATSGPGSFTGVRIGLASIKGLAEATGKAAAAVSNLAAMATFGSTALRAVVLDARRGEIYGAVYDACGAAVRPETVMPFPRWLSSLPDAELEFIATDFSPFAPALAGTRFAGAPVTIAPRALAAAVGRIAGRRLRAGQATDPAAIDANYVRRSDAELFWKEY